MRLSEFRYELPDELIAQYPTERRGASRLLYLDGKRIEDRLFPDIEGLLRPSDLLVLNNTRVMRARFHGRKETGGAVEVLLERLLPDGAALAQVRASKPPKPGSRLFIGETQVLSRNTPGRPKCFLPLEGSKTERSGVFGGVKTSDTQGRPKCFLSLEGSKTERSGVFGGVLVEGREGDFFRLRPEQGDWRELMTGFGHVPLPPYIRRTDGAFDESRYQTVFASREGAVAAPTAGLHFERDLLERLRGKGVETAEVTLHVGAGTFQPVRVEQIHEHRMHAEWVEVSETVCAQVAAARERGGRVIAVGTTCVRSLETAAASGELQPYCGETRIFITPGYPFRVVDALITNFHLPESTLLMLVCAFAGYEEAMAAYRHAVEQRYRFFSYGDAMFIAQRANPAFEGK